MSTSAARLIATRKSTIADYLRRLALAVEAVPASGDWANAGDLGRIEHALADLLGTHELRVVLDRDDMTVWYPTRAARDAARIAAAASVSSEIEIEDVEDVRRGYGLRIEGRTDEAIDEAVEILARLGE